MAAFGGVTIRWQAVLHADRYAAEGRHGPRGNFIVTRPAERNLDDAFRILAEQTRKGKKQERAEKRAEPPAPTEEEENQE